MITLPFIFCLVIYLKYVNNGNWATNSEDVSRACVLVWGGRGQTGLLGDPGLPHRIHR